MSENLARYEVTAKASPPVWLLVLVTMSGTLAMHMFVPALPYAAAQLQATVGQAQLTISTYIVGLAVGQLIYGPLSDAIGRRPALIAGLGLYLLGGLMAALTTSLSLLVVARLVQALGGCAGLALGRAIVRDTSNAQTVTTRLALLNLMMMIGPGLAPIIGSIIAATIGWRAIFGMLALLGSIALIFTWYLLPETTKPSGRLSPRSMLSDYNRLFRSKAFLGVALGGGIATTSIYAFIAAAPFVFVTHLHRPLHEVGLYLGLMIAGMSLGNIVTGQLVRLIPVSRLMVYGNTLSIVSAALLLLLVASQDGLTLLSLLVLVFLFNCGLGVTGPSALTKSLSVTPTLTGSAAGLYGFLQMAAGAISTSLVSLCSDPALGAVAVLFGAVTLAQVCFWFSLSQERKSA